MKYLVYILRPEYSLGKTGDVIKILLVLSFSCIIMIVSPDISSASVVTFSSSLQKNGQGPIIWGHLFRPEGKGPFPAVIIMHGCSGLLPRHMAWARRLVAWGYVALAVDSFRPRGVHQVCRDPYQMRPFPIDRASDIYGAARYLRKHSFVRPGSVGAIGFSHGGSSVLRAARLRSRLVRDNFLQAVVVFYPACTWRDRGLHTRTLILVGHKDDWTPAANCKKFVKNEPDQNIVSLKIYRGAYHSFDAYVSRPFRYFGHKLAYNKAATTDAIRQTRGFFGRYLDSSAFTVAQAQKILEQLGFDPGPIDGYWGARTRQALNAFRSSYQLPPANHLDNSSEKLLRIGVRRPSKTEP